MQGSRWRADFSQDVFQLIHRALDGTQALIEQFYDSMGYRSNPTGNIPAKSLSPSSLDVNPFCVQVGQARTWKQKGERQKAIAQWEDILDTLSDENKWAKPFLWMEVSQLLQCCYQDDDRAHRADALVQATQSCIDAGYFHLADSYRLDAEYHNKHFIWGPKRPAVPKVILPASPIEDDLLCQYQHCVEQIQAIRWKCMKLFHEHPHQSDYHSHVIHQAMSQACDVLIKLRGLLDQAFGRSLRYIMAHLCPDHILLQAKFPVGGSEARVKERVQEAWMCEDSSDPQREQTLKAGWKIFETDSHYQDWWEAVHCIQYYRHPNSWWHTLVTISNEIKHVRQFVPSVEEIQHHLARQSAPIHSDLALYFQAGDAKFSSGHWLPHMNGLGPDAAINTSVHIMQSLLNGKYLNGKFQAIETLKKIVKNRKKGRDDIKKELQTLWEKDPDIDLAHVDVDGIVERLWVHTKWVIDPTSLSKDEQNTFYRKHLLVDLLQRAVSDTHPILLALAKYPPLQPSP